MVETFILPKDMIKTYRIVKICININQFTLNQGCELFIQEIDENDVSQQSSYYTLSQDEFKRWGDDDNYVIDLILDKYGYVKS
jgi:hypothetical protein